jgi:hypothetical protein
MGTVYGKQRAWLGTHADGSEGMYLVEVEIANTAAAVLAWLRDIWCRPVVSVRDQLTSAERATCREIVRDMMTELYA